MKGILLRHRLLIFESNPPVLAETDFSYVYAPFLGIFFCLEKRGGAAALFSKTVINYSRIEAGRGPFCAMKGL
jgi:hypothetical protein